MPAVQLLLNELESVMNAVVTPDDISLHPGRWSPEGTDNTFGTFTVIPNRDYQQPYIHMDAVNLTIYHTNYGTLMALSEALLGLNQEGPHALDFYEALRAAKVYTQELVIRTSGATHNSFIESTEYHALHFDILFQYTEPVSQDSNVDSLLFIEGV